MTARSLALVESPAQLVNVAEFVHQADGGNEVTVVVLAPTDPVTRLQLRSAAALVAGLGLAIRWYEPRRGGAEVARTVRALTAELSGVGRIIVGDPFSGVIQVILSVCRPTQVVVVDDGTATFEFVRQCTIGEPRGRWHSNAPQGPRPVSARARERIAASVQRHLTTPNRCALTLFTSLPVTMEAATLIPNTFAWVRSLAPAPETKPGADLVGTSLVETGIVDRGHYVRAVSTLRHRYGVNRYFAHRKESPDKLAEIAGLGLRVIQPDLPLEITARRGPIARTVISFPSTVVHTLPRVLADASARVLVCDIDGDWLTGDADARSRRFLSGVCDSACDRYGLAAIAC
jgi:hypothetical protein